MGEIVYTASALKAFAYPLVAFFFFTVLGFTGLGVGIFRQKDKTISRIVSGCAGIVLCLVAVAMALITFRSWSAGAETISIHLNDKRVVTEKCGDDNRNTCTRYILETQSSSIFYDVSVGEDAYNSVDVNSCYAITYYPNDGLFPSSGKIDSYQQIGGVTRIETAVCP